MYHFAFCRFNFSFSVTLSGTLGYRRLVAVSNKVLVRRDINLCAGLVPIDSVGVFLWSSRANLHSRLHFSVSFVMMWGGCHVDKFPVKCKLTKLLTWELSTIVGS